MVFLQKNNRYCYLFYILFYSSLSYFMFIWLKFSSLLMMLLAMVSFGLAIPFFLIPLLSLLLPFSIKRKKYLLTVVISSLSSISTAIYLYYLYSSMPLFSYRYEGGGKFYFPNYENKLVLFLGLEILIVTLFMTAIYWRKMMTSFEKSKNPTLL